MDFVSPLFSPSWRIQQVIKPIEDQKLDAALRLLRHLRSMQVDQTNFIRKQPHLTLDLRAKLVEWMLVVGTNRYLDPETQFLAVHLFDGHLSRMPVKAYVAFSLSSLSLDEQSVQCPLPPSPPPLALCLQG